MVHGQSPKVLVMHKDVTEPLNTVQKGFPPYENVHYRYIKCLLLKMYRPLPPAKKQYIALKNKSPAFRIIKMIN